MKRIGILTVLVLALVFTGCRGSVEPAATPAVTMATSVATTVPSAPSARVRAISDPAVVSCKDGRLQWALFLYEEGGIGVELEEGFQIFYSSSGKASSPLAVQIEKLENGGVLAASGKMRIGCGLPCQSVAYAEMVLRGKDDRGNPIEVHVETKFLP